MDWIELTFWVGVEDILPESPRFRDIWDADEDDIPMNVFLRDIPMNNDVVFLREQAPSPEDFFDNEPIFAPIA